MSVKLSAKPILTNKDLVSLQSLSSGDYRTLINVLSAVFRKIVDWEVIGESMIVTDANGNQIARFGNSVDLVRRMTAHFTNTSVGFGSGTTSILNVAGDGILRKIAVLVTGGIGGGAVVELSSNRFAANLPLVQTGVFSEQAYTRAARVVGTGVAPGDLLLLDGLDLEYCGSLTLDWIVQLSGTGSAIVFTWYDSL